MCESGRGDKVGGEEDWEEPGQEEAKTDELVMLGSRRAGDREGTKVD